MTKLWEDTIVTALRDAQWLRCPSGKIPRSTFPPGFVKLDGSAESALGDVIYATNERYYIFEVKARRSGIKDEWKDSRGPKVAYKSLAEHWSKLEELSSVEDKNEKQLDLQHSLLNFFRLSLAGHHFVYWDDWVDGDGREGGEIVVESYVAACAGLFDEKKDVSPWQYLKPWPKNYFGFTWGEGADRLVSEVVSLNEALDCEVKICFSEDGGSRDRRMGLNIKELQAYVNSLVGEDEEEEGIFAVVMSNTGSFYRVVGSTRYLSDIMRPGAPATSPRRQRRATRRGVSPSMS
ncbi:hypothetical protein LYZ89_17895 [Xanthomonas hortorum pv. vitians]|uniref:hypothetical protein n=1 Tax=Xanthomonas hortorum TaxID=56454 RepID=UPI0012FDBFD5|nr:hypothetical protein [Xanthomonas hortorum]MCE4308368.1 hypothetical protein [Xanthomonas hortorum pv. vitians]MCE4338889.1 hypothetical protein [Xanthomonas hortorum pv. vitians]MCE4344038.1 hypothetical protein [Xanthomonas hortorum pv. vitians]MDT7822482.1 hypothetical protein [Xanthomonas hortorum pv. vitians]NMI41759.1 hypothetical protein [Xanthomonas hortorum pv. vitians]